MTENLMRRDFLGILAGAGAIGAAAGAGVAGAAERPAAGRGEAATKRPPPRRPVAVASSNGLGALERAMAVLRAGGRPLDAVVEGVSVVEDDPEDHSVGLGGIPNEEGVVELDASCMDGTTMRAGAVAALRNIQNPSRVARLVLERTTRVLLVAEGALKFARAHGFPEVELLTEKSRKIWLYWRERLNDRDDWTAGEKDLEDPDLRKFYQENKGSFWPQGTVHVSMLGPAGDLAGCTSTSGLYFKLPGRVGDSPIIGAGLYVDGEVGAAGSTGWGEGNLQSLGSHNVVEFMRQGLAPEAAALKACERLVSQLLRTRKDEPDAASRFNVTYYAVNAAGETGAASIWSARRYAVHDGEKGELRDAAFLYKRP